MPKVGDGHVHAIWRAHVRATTWARTRARTAAVQLQMYSPDYGRVAVIALRRAMPVVPAATPSVSL